MPRPVVFLLPTILCLGCLTEQEDTMLVSPNPFTGSAPQPARSLKSAPGYEPSIETAVRVDTLGRKILQANPQIGLRPMVRVIGSPNPEVFHIRTESLVLTDSMVNQCKTEGELAAVICQELGKMVSEREALTAPSIRNPVREPPMQNRIGNDQGGAFGAADGTDLAELAKFSPRGPRRPAVGAPMLPPDPKVLARNYLTKAGYAITELDTVAPLLDAAGKNCNWERQLNGAPITQTPG